MCGRGKVRQSGRLYESSFPPPFRAFVLLRLCSHLQPSFTSLSSSTFLSTSYNFIVHDEIVDKKSQQMAEERVAKSATSSDQTDTAIAEAVGDPSQPPATSGDDPNAKDQAEVGKLPSRSQSVGSVRQNAAETAEQSGTKGDLESSTSSQLFSTPVIILTSL
jgi:hypothetical protein